MPVKLFFAMSLTMLLLFGFLFGLLAAVGYFFGVSGYIIVILAILLVFLQWFIGPKIIWWTTNMRLLNKNEYPWLWSTVEDICKKYNVPIPKLAIVNTGAPNAFVFGRTPSSATLAVTRGLLDILTEDEVKSVIAHEIGHIKHKDMIVMTVVGAIPIITYFIARFLIFAPSSDERKSGAAFIIGITAFIIYFITNLLVLGLSRLREYYSDRFAGMATKPSLLASALIKIAYGLSVNKENINESVRAFFISDPMTSMREVSRFSNEYKDMYLSDKEIEKAMEWEKKNIFVRILELFQTHPLTFKRIAALKRLENELSKSL
jgi:heat shock protein HtpX